MKKLFVLKGYILLILSSCGGLSEEVLEAPEINGSYIEWDDASRMRIAPVEGSDETLSYPRLEILANGDYLLVYESVSRGSVYSRRSQDKGETWEEPQLIFASRNRINMSVPELIQLGDGSLLAAANLRPSPPYSEDRKFGIALRKSRDNGVSWGPEQLLYEAGHTFEDGCWEPSFLQLPGGEVHLYFADEAPYPHSDDQNISMLRSYDGGESWTDEPEIISYRQGSRDGMPVPFFLAEKEEILVVIEDKHIGEFKPSLVSESVRGNWSRSVGGDDFRRDYNPLQDYFYGSIYAGAPYLDRLSSGELVLSLQTTFGRSDAWDQSTMMVFVGDPVSGEFFWGTEPFVIPHDKRALWNSLAATEDGGIIALSSTNAYSERGNTEVWLVRGRLTE